jgi:hypothetical protein
LRYHFVGICRRFHSHITRLVPAAIAAVPIARQSSAHCGAYAFTIEPSLSNFRRTVLPRLGFIKLVAETYRSASRRFAFIADIVDGLLVLREFRSCVKLGLGVIQSGDQLLCAFVISPKESEAFSGL